MNAIYKTQTIQSKRIVFAVTLSKTKYQVRICKPSCSIVYQNCSSLDTAIKTANNLFNSWPR